MKNSILTLSLLSVLFLLNCNTSKNTEKTEEVTTTKDTTNQDLVGNDEDERGCKASAGYTWSALKNECVRIFEVADVKLFEIEQTKGYETFVAVIFDSEKSKAEIFLVDNKKEILEKRDEYTWLNKGYELKEKNGVYTIYISGKEIYQSK